MIYDSVVIGGGVMGSAIALRLSQAGQRVLVLEKAVPGAEASSAAGGILGAQIEGEADGPLFRLCLASREAYGALAAELRESTGIDVGYRHCGLLKVALAGDDLGPLAEKMAWQRRIGLEVEELAGEEVRRLEPDLASEVAMGLHFPKETQIDPRQLVQALPLAAQRAGATFRAALVRKVLVEDGRAVGVELDGETVRAGAVVVAAGAWTSLVEGIGLPHDAVKPVRGQMLKLALRGLGLRRIVFTPRGYLVPRGDGTVLTGSTMEHVGFDKRVTAGGVASILTNALATAPSLAGAELVESWSGLRPAPADGLPLIGATAAQGLFLASGHYRNGILLMPETARLVAETVLSGREPEALLPFSPRRFAH
ncbi:glycine oxidase ThiO [Vulgatibacter sp.]|uniref:glycine oxidase ThiO n=1 Tax=Vulgatibacter sp. TaxID=1971226 RepID=UPI0035644F2A